CSRHLRREDRRREHLAGHGRVLRDGAAIGQRGSATSGHFVGMQCSCGAHHWQRACGRRQVRCDRDRTVRQRREIPERTSLGRRMIRIETEPWRQMVEHARSTYPNECCGAMIGSVDSDGKVVRVALPLENAYEGAQAARYELRPEDLLKADREARSRKMDLVGIYHSHPDCGAYFSETDL